MITQAAFGSQHGHQFGNTGIYYFKTDEDSLILSDSIIANTQPIGDQPEFKIINIGVRNKALLWTFESTGNRHYEKTITFHHLQPGELTYLFSVESDYTNLASNPAESPEAPCEAYSSIETYSIRSSDADWFDVVVERIEYDYEKGCVGRIVSDKYLKKFI